MNYYALIYETVDDYVARASYPLLSLEAHAKQKTVPDTIGRCWFAEDAMN